MTVPPEGLFPIIDLEPSWVLADDAMGSKAKKWFLLPSGERWLFKYPRVNDGVPPGEHWVAPSFDHASCLGRELTEEKLSAWEAEPWRAGWYARRARGAIFDRVTDRHGANPLRLVEVVRRWRAELVEPWRYRLRSVSSEELNRIVEAVPGEFMTDRARRFTLSLLTHTQRELSETT